MNKSLIIALLGMISSLSSDLMSATEQRASLFAALPPVLSTPLTPIKQREQIDYGMLPPSAALSRVKGNHHSPQAASSILRSTQAGSPSTPSPSKKYEKTVQVALAHPKPATCRALDMSAVHQSPPLGRANTQPIAFEASPTRRVPSELAKRSPDGEMRRSSTLTLDSNLNSPDRGGAKEQSAEEKEEQRILAMLRISGCRLHEALSSIFLRFPHKTPEEMGALLKKHKISPHIARELWKERFNPLHLALSSRSENSEKIAQTLLCAGANVNLFDDESPLHIATRLAKGAIALELLEGGADITTIDQEFNTPLHYAAREGLVNVVRRMIEILIEKTDAQKLKDSDMGSLAWVIAFKNFDRKTAHDFAQDTINSTDITDDSDVQTQKKVANCQAIVAMLQNALVARRSVQCKE